jgi:hypothetical protein
MATDHLIDADAVIVHPFDQPRGQLIGDHRQVSQDIPGRAGLGFGFVQDPEGAFAGLGAAIFAGKEGHRVRPG